MRVLVAGGAGFVGRPLCRVLHDRGHEVTVASRSPDAPRLPASLSRVEMDVTRPGLSDAVAGHDAVVNLVALPSHREPRGRSHRAVHLEGTRNLVRACEATDVERFVQVSALGVDSDVETSYFRAKRGAERAVRESDLDWVVYRPSVIFGDGCAFLPFLRRITPPVAATLPGGGRLRIQPVWVGDLAPMLAGGVTDDRHPGECYEIGGPERLTLAEIVRQVCGARVVVPVPMALARLGLALCESVPFVPLGRDQYRVFRLDNTVADNDVAAFGVEERDLLTLSAYLDGARPDRSGA